MQTWFTRGGNGWLLLILLASLPIKIAAAQDMPFDIDYVPVLARGYAWLEGGPFPAVGTLSSVAAYNMPMLSWLHLPALALTRNGFLAILLTMLGFNLISTVAIFHLGKRLFSVRAGLFAATLFTFSQAAISASYTAWAQQLLPGYFALVLVCLWEWRLRERGLFLALAGILATAAFMTHFSAILLYPAMFIFALLSRARWQWSWLVVGILISGALLAPYLIFQTERDFADLRAFLSEEPLVGADVMAQYAYLKPGAGPLPEPAETQTPPVTNSAPEPAIASPRQTETSPRWQRALNLALRTPEQIFARTNMSFTYSTEHLTELAPPLATAARGVQTIWRATFWLVSLWAIGATLCAIWRLKARTWQEMSKRLVGTESGRLTLLLTFNYTVVAGFVLTRNMDQPTYFMGLQAVQWLLVAYGLHRLAQSKWLTVVALGLLIAHVGFNMAERSVRLAAYDNSVHSAFNVSIYRHIAGTAQTIANDWDRPDPLVVQYDLVPEMRTLWWIAPWSHTDPNYRYGWNFDFLLQLQHGLENLNTHPLGEATDPDYIVVYEPGLSRWDLDQYNVMRVGTIYVLKPKENR